MIINVRVKAAGKRKDVLKKTPYPIAGEVDSLRFLISEIVTNEVNKYNETEVDPEIDSSVSPNKPQDLTTWLTNSEIEGKKELGKIGFGRRYSGKDADPEKAVSNAIQSFEDGLYRVFLNEEEITDIDGKLNLKSDDELTFIRLTFLSGTLW